MRLDQVEKMQNSADPKTQSEHDGDKDGQAPKGAQAIRTPENPSQAVALGCDRRLRGGLGSCSAV